MPSRLKMMQIAFSSWATFTSFLTLSWPGSAMLTTLICLKKSKTHSYLRAYCSQLLPGLGTLLSQIPLRLSSFNSFRSLFKCHLPVKPSLTFLFIIVNPLLLLISSTPQLPFLIHFSRELIIALPNVLYIMVVYFLFVLFCFLPA